MSKLKPQLPKKRRRALYMPFDEVKGSGGRAYIRRLTPDLTKRLCELLKEGLPREPASCLLQVLPMQLYRWLDNGQAYLDAVYNGRRPDKDHQADADFLVAIKKAEAEWQHSLIKRSFQNRAASMWVRDMTMLERRDRKHWSRSETLAVRDAPALPDEAYL